MKKDIQSYRSIDIKTYFDGMKLAYKNAENYLYEADLLYEMRRYGHSLVLSVLGIEELGKASGYFYLMYFGVILNKKNETFYNKLYNNIHKSHNKKQKLSFAYSLIFTYFFKPLINVFDDYEKDKDLKNFKSSISKILINLEKKLKTPKIKKDIEYLNKLQSIKEIGMYVDITEDHSCKSYKDIKAKDARKCLDLLDKYLDMSHIISDITWDESIYDLLENLEKIGNVRIAPSGDQRLQ